MLSEKLSTNGRDSLWLQDLWVTTDEVGTGQWGDQMMAPKRFGHPALGCWHIGDPHQLGLGFFKKWQQGFMQRPGKGRFFTFIGKDGDVLVLDDGILSAVRTKAPSPKPTMIKDAA